MFTKEQQPRWPRSYDADVGEDLVRRTPAEVTIAIVLGAAQTGGGLGLQIVRTLVEGELSGTLTIEPGAPGTRVTLDLPTMPPER